MLNLNGGAIGYWRHLAAKTWLVGDALLQVLEQRWDPQAQYLERATIPIGLDDYVLGLDPVPFRQRLYTVAELREVLASVGMSLRTVFGPDGAEVEPTDAEPEVFVVAQKD